MLMARWRLETNLRLVARQTAVVLMCICVFSGVLFFTAWLKTSEPKSVERFGSVKVGGYLPSFIGVSQSGRKIGPIYPVGGKFYIHVVDARLPATCLDLECGRQARVVVDKRGHLIGGSDFKYGEIFGIKTVKTSSLIRRVLYHVRPFAERLGLKIQVHFWRLETSLVIVANHKGQVIRIYKNAGIKDVPRIVSNLEDSELCPP